MSDVRINTRSPYYIEANPTAPEVPDTPEIPDPPTNTPPTVTITASNQNPFAGETVTLTAVATDSDGTIVSYLWGGTSTPLTTASIDVTSTEVESKIFNVIVTDDDGDAAVAQITINWQEIPEQTTNTDLDVECGDVINEGSFIGTKTYNLVGVGDKIGDVEIEFLTSGNNQNLPVIFDLSWNGATTSTGYIGHSDFSGTFFGTDNTGDPTTKAQPTTLTINKSAATPTQVTLTASTGMSEGNDAYSFRLNCPDVEETITKFYTVKSTTAGGSTDFTYTDVNGDSQTVTVEEGETDLISAQEDTVSVTSGTGTIEEGGQSFDLGTPEQEINSKTELTIVFDDSGSMNDTLSPLQQVADGNLKDTLLEFYNYDVVEYNKRVSIVKSYDLAISLGLGTQNREDFLSLAKAPARNSDTTKQIFLYFTDEVFNRGGLVAYQYNAVSPLTGSYSERTSLYDTDISSFRTFLNTKTYGEYFLKVFNVNFNETNISAEAYDAFIDNIFSGENGFEGSKGLSDRSEASVVSDIKDGVKYIDNPDYYHDLIITALRGYGFNI